MNLTGARTVLKSRHLSHHMVITEHYDKDNGRCFTIDNLERFIRRSQVPDLCGDITLERLAHFLGVNMICFDWDSSAISPSFRDELMAAMVLEAL